MFWKYLSIIAVVTTLVAPVSATTINVTSFPKSLNSLDLRSLKLGSGSQPTLNSPIKKIGNQIEISFSLLGGGEAIDPSLTFTGAGIFNVEVFQVGVGSLGNRGIYMGGGTLTWSLIDPNSPILIIPQAVGDQFEVTVTYWPLSWQVGIDVAFTLGTIGSYCSALSDVCDPIFPEPSAVPLPAGAIALVSGIGALGGLAVWRRKRKAV